MTFAFDPLRDLLRNSELQKDFDTLFGGVRQDRTWSPSVEITEYDHGYSVEMDLPGLNKEDVKISLENNVLTISGTRRQKTQEQANLYHHNERIFGAFNRSFNLSKLINANAIEAIYENGVLRLNLPKVEEAKPREVEIKIA